MAENTDSVRTSRNAILLTVVVGGLLVVLRNAWMSDDAYITLRTVDHFVEGRGLTWNPGERVQAYTHPLWMLCLSGVYFITGEEYFSSIGLSLLVTLGALVCMIRYHGERPKLCAALIVALVSTRAFVDFSTSGLENPLTHLLLIVFAGEYFAHEPGQARDRLGRLALLACLLVLTRMDTVLLVGPALLDAIFRSLRAGVPVRRLVARLALASVPFFVWELFSLVYYGALVPNTALAKLSVGVARSDLVAQGLLYLLDTVERDPLTALLIFVPLAMVIAERRFRSLGPLALGSTLYLAYTVWIGGDFMNGRFLTPPLVLGCLLLTKLVPRHSRAAPSLALVAAVIGLIAERPTLLPYEEISKKEALGSHSITDEQAFWFPETGLLTASRTRDLPWGDEREDGETAVVTDAREVGAAGIRGFFSPPGVYLMDHNALVDSFLARLPAHPKKWRPGHFRRAIPEGYEKTLLTGTIHLRERKHVELYEDVRAVVRGPLFSSERWGAIWRLHTRNYR